MPCRKRSAGSSPVCSRAWRGPLGASASGIFRKAWATACRRAGVPGRIPHDFRRTAVRNMEQAGVPRSVAMKLTGHKTESVYRRYAIVSDTDLQEAARRLAGEGAFSGAFSPAASKPAAQVGKIKGTGG